MNLYIPKVSDVLKLSKPWTFSVYSERRNDKLGEELGLITIDKNGIAWWKGQDKKDRYGWIRTIISGKHTFKKGTELTVDRVYIRKGDAADYNSISFRTRISGRSIRFWAKLDDVNTMEIEL